MLEFSRISYKEAKPWILTQHYARRLPCITDSFGLFYDKTLIGVCTFGVPASPFLCRGICGPEYAHQIRELNRLVILDSIKGSIHNAASQLVSYCLKEMRGYVIVSYADTQWGHFGIIYQATNFLYTGITKPRTDIFSGTGKHARHHKGDKNKRQYRSAKHRYVFFSGSKTMKKKWMRALRYPICSRPRGISSRYDINNPVPSMLQDLDG